jgi:DNA-binding SARP family transcriptional activator
VVFGGSSLRPLDGMAPGMPAENGRPSGYPAEQAFLTLLGGFELEIAGKPLALPRRVQRLIAFLALRGRPLHRAYVAGRLWLDASQEQAYGSLRVALWNARRLHCPVVEASTTHISLSRHVRVDAHAVVARAESILHGTGPAGCDDVDLLVGAAELLPGWYEDWVLPEREWLHELRVLALERAGENLLAAQRNSEAAIAGLAAVHADPLRESAYSVLIRAHLAAGDVAEAFRHLHTFTTNIRGSLGVAPSTKMQELAGAMRADRSDHVPGRKEPVPEPGRRA